MKIVVRDFQMVERADVVAGDGITLVAGQNSAGKSSIAKAAAAVLTGQLQYGLAKKDAGKLVRAGRDAGSVRLQAEGGTALASWTKGDCSFSCDGKPPTLSHIAAGLASIVDMTPTERAAGLTKLLHAVPTEVDLVEALKDAGVGEKAIADELWKRVEALGWDGAFADFKEKGTKHKGRWEQVTGEKWGEKKAAGWKPAGWIAELADASPDDLQAEVGEARQELERAIAAAAVDQAEVARLELEASALPTAEEASVAAQTVLAQAEAVHTSAVRRREALPPADPSPVLTCPCCKETLTLKVDAANNKTLEKGERINADEMKERRIDIARHDGQVSKAKGELEAANVKARDAETAVRAAQEAGRMLAELRAKAAEQGSAGTDVGATRAKLAEAEARLAMLTKYLEADKARRLVATNIAVQSVLAPDGVRQAKLVKVLDTFNTGILRPLCEAANWQDVRVEPDANLTVTYGGRPYAQLAGLGPQLSSDQFRVRAVLQVALAQRAGDEMVIIDAADVLDREGREGLIGMLATAEMHALVCMTFSAPGIVPDLERAGLGRSYWVEDGLCRPLGEALTAAAMPAAAE